MKLQSLVLAAATALTMTSAFAVPAGTWSIAAGAHYVDPKSDNGTVSTVLGDFAVDVDGDVRPTISGEYFIADNVGVELLAAIPFHHDITLKAGETTIDAKTQHLPPTLSVQYHFDGYNLPMNVKPFVGVGVNYTTFFKEKVYIPLAGDYDLDLDDSVGVAGHIGLDIPYAPTESFRIDARYMDIKTDAKLDGNDIGEVDISPWVYGVAFVKQF
ncbi:OmpW family outer membrane protein [uncultured Psychrobacter sp.]|uniref:OmpW/AlkL family protein n=1 Tax=uncultured Psychrobacter sp. TaxID=259303 RepID=UPI00261997DD|nr:OmpW family outer membrane protein [uncultured Psychrobacter sp.]